ncbi:MAG TPA: SDR family NAD(P)-dependent oxidoreductase [bacterium]|nr:SDR family NAD(P)-dependent oxidoreductase [bacterium]
MANYLITGASSGIGQAMCRQAVQQGHTVYGIARRAEVLAEMQNELGERFVPFPADVSDHALVAELCNNLPALPDVAILNAGVGIFDNRHSLDVTVHERTFAVNYFGVLNFIHELMPRFLERGHGTFVGVSSLAAYRGMPMGIAYGASKAALSSALESMRVTYHGRGIDFLTVHPGFVDTPINAKNTTPMPFLWKPEKAAAFILRGVAKRKLNIVFPLPIRLGMLFARFLPAGLHARIMKAPAKKH